MNSDLSSKGTVLQDQILTSSLALVLSAQSLMWNAVLLSLKETIRLRIPFPLEPDFTSFIWVAFYSAESPVLNKIACKAKYE